MARDATQKPAYQSLSADDILSVLPKLSANDLRRVRDFEAHLEARPEILGTIDRLLAERADQLVDSIGGQRDTNAMEPHGVRELPSLRSVGERLSRMWSSFRSWPQRAQLASWAVVAVVLLGIVAAAAAGSDGSSKELVAPTTAVPPTFVATTEAPTTIPPTTTTTISLANGIDSPSEAAALLTAAGIPCELKLHTYPYEFAPGIRIEPGEEGDCSPPNLLPAEGSEYPASLGITVSTPEKIDAYVRDKENGGQRLLGTNWLVVSSNFANYQRVRSVLGGRVVDVPLGVIPPEKIPLVYEVSGSGSALITYSVAGFSQEQVTARLPWRKQLLGDRLPHTPILSAQLQSTGTIACRISRGDMFPPKASTSSGAYVVVTCS